MRVESLDVEAKSEYRIGSNKALLGNYLTVTHFHLPGLSVTLSLSHNLKLSISYSEQFSNILLHFTTCFQKGIICLPKTRRGRPGTKAALIPAGPGDLLCSQDHGEVK